MKDWVRDLAAARFPPGRYSQGGQDGILAEIFRHVGTVNTPPFAVEFGFNADALDAGTGAHIARPVLDEGWSAVLLDGVGPLPVSREGLAQSAREAARGVVHVRALVRVAVE